MQYDTGAISHSTFCSLSKEKLAFLSENLESFPTNDKRLLALEIINKCKKIYMDYAVSEANSL